jgi:hypothetical protein
MIAVDIILFIVLVAIGVMLDAFYSIPLRTQTWALSIVITILLIRVLRGQRNIVRKEEAMTIQEQKLVDGVKSLADAVDNEEAHIDTIIEALKLPADSPIVAQVIADLEATKSKVAAFQVAAFHADAPPESPV